jgi:hypothetical protein
MFVDRVALVQGARAAIAGPGGPAAAQPRSPAT